MFPDTPLQRWLECRYACQRARRWVGRRSLERAIRECTEIQWLLWLTRYVPNEPYVGFRFRNSTVAVLRRALLAKRRLTLLRANVNVFRNGRIG